jgi:hypothetical protein
MLKEKLLKLFEEANVSVQLDFFNQEAKRASYNDERLSNFLDELEKHAIDHKEVEHYGGEGEGDEYYRVYSFSIAGETLFIKFDGSYQSYVGAEYGRMFFVTPKSVTVTKYFKS